MVINVHTTANTEVPSRKELLSWFSDLLGGTTFSPRRIEDLSDGCIPAGKINAKARHAPEMLANWKLMQACFRTLGVDKAIPADRLIKSKFLDNLEFAQWFKCFYDANVSQIQSVVADENNMNTTYCFSKEAAMLGDTTQDLSYRDREDEPTACNGEHTNDTMVLEKSNSSLMEVSSQIQAMAQDLEIAVKERQFYYEKLRKMELLLEKYDPETNPLAKELASLLYEVEEGFTIPTDADQAAQQ